MGGMARSVGLPFPARGRREDVSRCAAQASVFELRDEFAQFGGHGGELLRGALRIACAVRCALRGFGDAGDVFGDFAGAASGFGDVARHFVGGGVLLFDRGGDGVRNVVDLGDDAGDRADGFDRALGVDLDAFDLAADVFGGFGGFLGEFFYFVGDDGKTFARFARTRGFDGGVEREEVGLLRDRGDDLDDLADFDAGFAELADRDVGCLSGFDSFGGDLGGFGSVLGDFLDGDAHFFAAGGDRLEIAVDLFTGSGDDVGLRGGFFGVGAHLLADGGEFSGGGGERGGGLADLANAGAQVAEKLGETRAHLADGVLAADGDFLGEVTSRSRGNGDQHRIDLATEFFGGDFFGSHICADDDDLHNAIHFVAHRAEAGLQVDLAAILGDIFENADLAFPSRNCAPEVRVRAGTRLRGVHQNLVVLSDEFLLPVAVQFEKVRIGGEKRAVDVELRVAEIGIDRAEDAPLIPGVRFRSAVMS